MQTTAKSPIQANPIPSVVRYRIQRIVGFVLSYGILILLSAFVLLPLGWMLTVALKPDRTPYFTIPPEWLPTRYWQWDNFRRALFDSVQPFLRYTLNTLLIVVGNMAGTLFSCSLVAYAFARLRFRGSAFLFNLLIITMLIPWQVLMIPQFLMYHAIGWYGTYLPLIVPSFTGNAFFIFLIRQYMRSFPRDLDESARLDGCNYWQIFWYIILPLSAPVLIVCMIFVFQSAWSDLLGPLIYLDSNNKFTLAVGLANMVTRTGIKWNLLMAANLITIIPMVVVYFFAQEKLIGGIASVGLKG